MNKIRAIFQWNSTAGRKKLMFLYFIEFRLTLGANQPPGQSAAGFLNMALRQSVH